MEPASVDRSKRNLPETSLGRNLERNLKTQDGSRVKLDGVVTIQQNFIVVVKWSYRRVSDRGVLCPSVFRKNKAFQNLQLVFLTEVHGCF